MFGVHIVWAWEGRMATRGQKVMAQQRAKCCSSRKHWASAWAAPMDRSCKCQRRSLRRHTQPFFARHLWPCWRQKVCSNGCTLLGQSPQSPHILKRGSRWKISPGSWKRHTDMRRWQKASSTPGCFHWRTTYGLYPKSLHHRRNPVAREVQISPLPL